MNQFLLQF
jgi:hypothetical protein